MKIDASKNHSAERKESKNVFKTESSVFKTENPLKSAEAVPAPPQSAFAKILEETRRQNEKDNSQAAKADSGEKDSKISKSEQEIESPTDKKKELEERSSHNGDGDTAQNGDEHQTPTGALAALQSPTNPVPETSAPAARSILHVADLERIVAMIRTETFQNQKQVVIALKNSVLQGLQIKLTITENGKLKAEFLALNEQIKKQIGQRRNELAEILKNRSPLFSEIEIKSQDYESS